MLATKLLGKVKEKFGVELAVRDLFVHSSVSAMAKMIDGQESLTSRETLPTVDLIKEVDSHDQPIGKWV